MRGFCEVLAHTQSGRGISEYSPPSTPASYPLRKFIANDGVLSGNILIAVGGGGYQGPRIMAYKLAPHKNVSECVWVGLCVWVGVYVCVCVSIV